MELAIWTQPRGLWGLARAWHQLGLGQAEAQSLALSPALKQVGNLLGPKSGQKAESQGQTHRMLFLSLSWHGRFSLVLLLPPLLVPFIKSRQDHLAL